jgi:diadenosine tetraphosphate (Ap4A) HIT family hydrolase
MREVPEACPFCRPEPRLIIAENALAVAILDAYPVNPGHALVIPRRHVSSWFDASRDERIAMLILVDEVRRCQEAASPPAGYNIGLNVGEAAGQTVGHVHVHVIPRYTGDVDDPSGGVRFVIPARGNYRRPGHIPSAKE